MAPKGQRKGNFPMANAAGTLFDLKGKTALITGSTKGIGKAIAEQFASHGARVTISSRKPGPCEEVAAAINASHGGGTAIACPANISSKEDLQRLVNETNAAFGKIDIVVCNAASNPYYGPMAGIQDDAFAKILSNNIISNNWLIQMVAPQMIERKDGAVIIVSSIGGLRASTVIGAYCI
jgi:NAD(P)-dependent dehydrogenase (short-subunit alcohol dehydrogenase family)